MIPIISGIKVSVNHGAFVKEIGSGERKGLKAFFYHRSLNFYFQNWVSTASEKILNSENKNRIPKLYL